ncbi:ARM repeat-containing protein [Meredithblackwellia eburnea MCA 4105]
MTELSPEVLSANLASLSSQLNTSSTPLAQRFRALFTLKHLGSTGHASLVIPIISHSLPDPDSSALLGHELAYCLGQIRSPLALPVLEQTLRDDRIHVMVRHEAAEAIGAIGQQESLEVLGEFRNHEERAIRETAEIAWEKVRWDNSEEGREERRKEEERRKDGLVTFTSIDPAPPSSNSSPFLTSLAKPTSTPIPELTTTLLNPSLSLFDRYRAMFALRNDGGAEAVEALAKGFGDESALFRHEIAFIFGQLLSPHSIPSLISVLRNNKEDEMVRHEAAEALGGIADEEKCLPVLMEYREEKDKEGNVVPKVVRESCVVALDMYEYEQSGDFNYAVPIDTSLGVAHAAP